MDEKKQHSLSSNRAEIITTPTFRSVREAEYAETSPGASYSISSSQFTGDEDESEVLSLLKKLQHELEETKHELMLLKRRESDTELLVASINSELRKRMSMLEAAKNENGVKQSETAENNIWGKKNQEMFYGYLPNLTDHTHSFGWSEGDFGGWNEPKIKKKKPIVPLVGDLFRKN